MIIFPAIDIKDGKCVRLYQGNFSTSNVVAQDPVSTAHKFKDEGAEYIHIVDLDGARTGRIQNIDIIKSIINVTNLNIEVGGGIRNLDTIRELIDCGVSRVILGTAALNDPQIVVQAVKEYGDKIAVGIDAKNGYVAVDGWINVSKVGYIDFAKKMEDIGVKTIIFTDISRDGTLTGPNFEETINLNESVSCDITASGGIKSIDDLKVLSKNRIYGAIIGKALYSKDIKLEEALGI